MRYIILLISLIASYSLCAGEAPKRMTQEQIKEMKKESRETPINTFRYLGNALVCKSDKDEIYACYRIGGLKINEKYEPKKKPWKEVLQKDGSVASVFPIVANEQHNAYWVVGHKNNKITSVQITGNYPHEQLAFSTIMLGDKKEKVRKILGPRYHEREVKEINGQLWDYSPFKITIEFVNNLVYSMRVAEYPSNKAIK